MSTLPEFPNRISLNTPCHALSLSRVWLWCGGRESSAVPVDFTVKTAKLYIPSRCNKKIKRTQKVLIAGRKMQEEEEEEE